MKRSCFALAIVLLASSLMSSMRAQEAVRTVPANLAVEILSDTQGADLSSYIRAMLPSLKTRWSSLVAETKQPPLHQPDETVISLTIAPDGHVSAMKLEHSSGNPTLDRAAWGAATSTHYAPLPAAMKDSSLKMRILFPATSSSDSPNK